MQNTGHEASFWCGPFCPLQAASTLPDTVHLTWSCWVQADLLQNEPLACLQISLARPPMWHTDFAP